uniref:Alpha-1,3-glucosyltransferase n=1 Tax=Chenopodium quinoa TaxID=63459 RepID=A0A803NDQ2_CHEQI
MRWTVLSSDILVFLPAVFYFVLSYSASRSRRHQSDVALACGNDFTESMSYCNRPWPFPAVISSRELVACTLFTLALSHKQMSAYFAPAFFSHLLGRCLRRRNPFLEVSKLALVVIGTFAVVWWPYLHSKEAFLEV